MKKNIIWLLAIFIFTTTPILASAPPSSPICKIKGLVKTVEMREAGVAECVKLSGKCPTDIEFKWADRYYFTVEIKQVEAIKEDEGYKKCNDLIQIQTTKEYFIDKSDLKAGEKITLDTEIEGQVSPYYGKIKNFVLVKTVVNQNKSWWEQLRDFVAQLFQ